MATRRTNPVHVSSGELKSFMHLFGAFIERAQSLTDPNVVLADAVLQRHLGAEAGTQPIVSESFTTLDHINLVRALTALHPRVLKLAWYGLIGDHRWSDLNLASLIVGGRYANNQVGPLQYRNQPSGVGTHEACISFGFATGTYRNEKIALLLRLGEPHGPLGGAVRLEIVSPSRDLSETLLNDIRAQMDREMCTAPRC